MGQLGQLGGLLAGAGCFAGGGFEACGADRGCCVVGGVRARKEGFGARPGGCFDKVRFWDACGGRAWARGAGAHTHYPRGRALARPSDFFGGVHACAYGIQRRAGSSVVRMRAWRGGLSTAATSVSAAAEACDSSSRHACDSCERSGPFSSGCGVAGGAGGTDDGAKGSISGTGGRLGRCAVA